MKCIQNLGGFRTLDYSDTEKNKDKKELLEVYWPPITFSTSIWLWWNAVLSPATPNMTVQMTTHHLVLPDPPPPMLLFVDQKPVKRTHFYIIRPPPPPAVETKVLGTVARMAGGTIQMRGGAVRPFLPRVKGKIIKNKPLTSQDKVLYRCFGDCNGFLMRH